MCALQPLHPPVPPSAATMHRIIQLSSRSERLKSAPISLSCATHRLKHAKLLLLLPRMHVDTSVFGFTFLQESAHIQE